MTQWEYQVAPIPLHNEALMLNNFGQDGWELVAIHTNAQGGLVAFLKRPSGRRPDVGAEARLAELGITVPEVVPPVAAYQPTARTGNLVFTAGQLPARDGEMLAIGKLGAEVSEEQGYECARQCALNALAAVKAEIGSLDDVKRVVKVVVFVASTPDFTGQPKVANGASELLGEVFGDAGKHARSAVGVSVLPLDVPVEVEIIVEV